MKEAERIMIDDEKFLAIVHDLEDIEFSIDDLVIVINILKRYYAENGENSELQALISVILNQLLIVQGSQKRIAILLDDFMTGGALAES